MCPALHMGASRQRHRYPGPSRIMHSHGCCRPGEPSLPAPHDSPASLSLPVAPGDRAGPWIPEERIGEKGWGEGRGWWAALPPRPFNHPILSGLSRPRIPEASSILQLVSSRGAFCLPLPSLALAHSTAAALASSALLRGQDALLPRPLQGCSLRLRCSSPPSPGALLLIT